MRGAGASKSYTAPSRTCRRRIPSGVPSPPAQPLDGEGVSQLPWELTSYRRCTVCRAGGDRRS